MADPKKLKLRCTYPAGFRAGAKKEGKGVATISIEFSNGDRMEEQGYVDELQGEFLKWSMAMVFCKQVTDLPDLERIVRNLIQ